MTNDAFHTYTFDAEGNMTAVDGGVTAQYVYDAFNHRVRTVVGSTITEFVFNSNGQRVSEWNGTSRALLRGHYFWGAKPVAYYAGGATHFEHQDWLGTERMRTTYTGGVEGSYTSLPFGDGQSTTGADLDPYHYAQLDYDSESSSDHAQFRQFSNTQGRWLSPDPYVGSYDGSNPQSMNRYVYLQNRPLNSIDPSGLDQYFWADGCLWYSYTTITAVTSASGGDFTFSTDVHQTLLTCENWGSASGGDGGRSAGSGGGGAGSGGGNGTAPNTETIRPMSRLECASYRADKELSIASMTSGGSPDNPAVQAFLGNSISGVVNLFTTNENPLTNLVTGGWNPGVPGVPAPEIGGYALDGGLTGVVTKGVLGGATDLFALPKLAYDAASFLGAAAFLCR